MSAAFGRWLLELGALPDERALEDVLARQSERLPIASVAYVLGYADERTLAGVLAAANGRAAAVLDESVVELALLDGVGAETWLGAQLVPIAVEGGRVYVASAHPEQVDATALVHLAGRGQVVIALALAVTVARTIRAALAARARGEATWPGAMVDAGTPPRVVLVGADEDATIDGGALVGDEPLAELAHDDDAAIVRAIRDDSTKELDVRALIEREPEAALDDELPSQIPILAPRGSAWPTDGPWSRPGGGSVVEAEPGEPGGDGGDVGALVAAMAGGPPHVLGEATRVLVVDDDYATRQLLVKELAPRGYEVATAEGGDDAIRAIAGAAPDVVIADILLPGVDGFRLCRAIKQTPRLRDVAVILMSAVIESGRVTPEVLLRYSADGYAAKPLDTTRLLRIVRELLGQRRAALGAAADEAALKRALDRYEAGDRGGAIAALRERVAARPGAARVRFALANLLQRERQRDDAVREYEAVIAAQPDYFPALTRLAYLYYERGQHGRAVETWRRALPYCPDRQLRRNIELFVRSLAKAPR
ncbi:MAG: response regulator [Kofleriaceae bacterium]|nr:response regulator [Kofleriaceae bacterium]MBP9169778.1 response regulator [Kofleriaceae bacterium]MBP9862209.1 response regulator [Kofleriaceae bacterium]